MKLFEVIKVNQWKNTINAIERFISLKYKHRLKLIMFYIKGFYPSITQDLLGKTLNFDNEYLNISKCDTDVIHHARKSLVFDSSHTCIKKQGGLLDVTMSAYDGAEVFELVDTYVLKVLSKEYIINNLESTVRFKK